MRTDVTIMEKVLGTSSVSKGAKTTVVKRVVDKLGLEVGDLIVYVECKDGSIHIRKG